MTDEEARARIEAALYAAGRPLSPKDLTLAAGITSMKKAVKFARRVAKTVNSSLKAVEVVELRDQKFAMQLKREYTKIAKKFSIKPLIPRAMLKTLSFVAYFQPITAHEVAQRRGKHAYPHLKVLEDFGFISGEPLGRTRVYRTTSSFAEYFGLSNDPAIIKSQLSKMGLQERVPGREKPFIKGALAPVQQG